MFFPKTSRILFLCGGIVLDFYFHLSADKCFLKLSAVNIYNGITGSLSGLNSVGTRTALKRQKSQLPLCIPFRFLMSSQKDLKTSQSPVNVKKLWQIKMSIPLST